MASEEANQLVVEYEKSGVLPAGFAVDIQSSETTLGGDEYEVVYIYRDGKAVISYDRRNGQPENVSVNVH